MIATTQQKKTELSVTPNLLELPQPRGIQSLVIENHLDKFENGKFINVCNDCQAPGKWFIFETGLNQSASKEKMTMTSDRTILLRYTKNEAPNFPIV